MKRTRQFFMDGSEGELSSNNEQGVQAISDHTPVSIPATVNFSFQGECISTGYPFPLRLEENKFDRGNVSFEGFRHEPEGSGKVMISSYVSSMSESSASNSLTDKSTIEHSADQIETTVAPKRTFGTENEYSKEKVQKKTTPSKSSVNNFPSHVKSLLSTGILDGVFVKYVSWCREKSVRGVIKGTGYMCGCNDCKFSKNLNAFQFESHAGCKTRHPNNHIYFENGKTIYAVVQELKRTPPEMLFDAIQNITGSPINQKNFQTWKESFQAAAKCEVAKSL